MEPHACITVRHVITHFSAVMLDLQAALKRGSEPENSGRDHLNTLAMVEASYRSMSEARSVGISEVW